MAGLGYSSDIGKLAAWKADAFVLIEAEYERLQAEKQKKEAGKLGHVGSSANRNSP
jgi:hypothetical protein